MVTHPTLKRSAEGEAVVPLSPAHSNSFFIILFGCLIGSRFKLCAACRARCHNDQKDICTYLYTCGFQRTCFRDRCSSSTLIYLYILSCGLLDRYRYLDLHLIAQSVTFFPILCHGKTPGQTPATSAPHRQRPARQDSRASANLGRARAPYLSWTPPTRFRSREQVRFYPRVY